ncbi:hypothetical protein CHARACLAT_029885 [Characodon lateralis]|uniref:Ig-like domain-containing protein n=1 Tax=Characodon lateralis TaxID=208331 RepID=A0ABU7E4Z5_9TELE|nr:hypothetical protein [Characodon lateralis]
MGYKCQQILKDHEVFVHLNEDVRLQCLKPSKRATLRWSFSPTVNLTENRVIQASDGSLRFFASNRTLGSYSCKAEEGGVSEEVVRYRVQLAASPRRLSTVNEESVSKSPEELFEDIGTEEPTNTLIKNEERSQPKRNPKEDPEQHVTTAKGGTFSRKTQSIQDVSGFVEVFPTSRKDSKSMLKPSEEALEQRSYHSELVVVSLLLAICILVLAFGLFRIWRQKKAGSRSNQLLALEDGSKTNTSEQICALSTLVQAGQDQTIIQQQ